MSLLALASITIVCLVAGYFLYGSFIARQYRLDDRAATPAVERDDGVDFVPTKPFYLLGQHFSAIAAAGPIVGPITACLMFGWGPCVLWIIFGVILIGAVHDFSALVASVRHGAHSIAEIAKVHLGTRAWYALIGFIWLALLYVIVAFTDVTARTFQGLSEELMSVPGAFNKGGAVAASSVMYMGLALLMGMLTRYARMSTLVGTLIFVPATLGVVYLGSRVDHLLDYGPRVWYAVILGYCLVASMLPMWLLQQPRGYLGGFILYLAIGVGLVGVLFGGFEIQQPAWKESASMMDFLRGGEGAPDMLGLMFPFLFVTIACGACSGFHGLICGGTTSKQISRESHCQPVAFGAMLLEGLVAIIALATVMIVAQGDLRARAPGVLYGDGLAMFITRFLDPGALLLDDPMRSSVFVVAATFGAMAFSTFVFDTLDVSTRLGRYLLCELAGTSSRLAGGIAAALTAGIPLAVLLAPATTGAGRPAWMMFWTLFGTANQLLASLTLLGVTVWLYRTGRRYWYTLLPMIFVFGVTMTALTTQILAGVRTIAADGLAFTPSVLNAMVGMALLVLALVFVVEAWRAVRRHALARAAHGVREN